MMLTLDLSGRCVVRRNVLDHSVGLILLEKRNLNVKRIGKHKQRAIDLMYNAQKRLKMEMTNNLQHENKGFTESV